MSAPEALRRPIRGLLGDTELDAESGKAMGDGMAGQDGDYNGSGADDAETRRLLARYPAPVGDSPAYMTLQDTSPSLEQLERVQIDKLPESPVLNVDSHLPGPLLIESLPRVSVTGASQATRDNASEMQRLLSRANQAEASNFLNGLFADNSKSSISGLPPIGSPGWWAPRGITGNDDARRPVMKAIDVQAERAQAEQDRRTYRTIVSAAGGPVLTGYAAAADLMGAPPEVYDNIAQANADLGLVLHSMQPGAISVRPVRTPLEPSSRGGSISGAEEVKGKDVSPEDARSLKRQNETLNELSKHFDVDRLPDSKKRNADGSRNPDTALNNQLADVYSPGQGNLRTIQGEIKRKLKKQAPNVVLNLADSPYSADQVLSYLRDWPVEANNLLILKDGIWTMSPAAVGSPRVPGAPVPVLPSAASAPRR